jgi:hypothetical protein
MHHKLCVLYHGHLPIEERPSTKEEHKMKLEDWEKDVAPLRNFDFVSNKMLDKDPTQSLTLNKFGTPIMTRKHFVSSWFHMADMWTDNISSELYTNFLKFTLSKIAVVNQHGVLEWRSDQSISTLMTDHYMTEEEKEIKRQQRQAQQEQEQEDQHDQQDQQSNALVSSVGMKVVVGVGAGGRGGSNGRNGSAGGRGSSQVVGTLSNEEKENAVQICVSMGFERNQSEKVLVSVEWRVDQAVPILEEANPLISRPLSPQRQQQYQQQRNKLYEMYNANSSNTTNHHHNNNNDNVHNPDNIYNPDNIHNPNDLINEDAKRTYMNKYFKPAHDHSKYNNTEEEMERIYWEERSNEKQKRDQWSNHRFGESPFGMISGSNQ